MANPDGFQCHRAFIASIAFDVLGSYTLIFLIFSALVMTASVLMFLAKPPTQQMRDA